MGISRAIERKGGITRTIAYCEREMYATKNLCAKIEEGKLHAAPIFTDLRTFPYRKFRGLVDIACAGIPCQPHSNAGKKRGGADERFLFDEFINGLEEMQPRAIFIENVEGLLSSKMPDGTLCLGYVLQRLRDIGYRVETANKEPTWGLFSASEVGAPHQRKRLFILGVGDSEYARQLASRNIKVTQREPRGQEGSIKQSKRSSKLSYADSKRRDGDELPRRQGEKQSRTPLLCADVGRWPARPNEPQHAWEEPRTKPKVGRAANGVRSRVDELRLLGNGVVPTTAELAFRTLIEKFM